MGFFGARPIGIEPAEQRSKGSALQMGGETRASMPDTRETMTA